MDPLIPVGRPVPDFQLPDPEGRFFSPSLALGRILILNFWSSECPWSARTDRQMLETLPSWGDEIWLWSIASNHNEPTDQIVKTAAERGLPQVLLDKDAEVAARLGAQTTPHLFVCDSHGLLRYQGAFDDVTFRRRTPTRSYLLEAVEALRAGRNPDPAVTQPYGCTIVSAWS